MTEAIEVLLFGPDFPVAGKLSQCQINEDAITIPLQRKTVAFDQLKAEIGGFEHDQLQLHWQHKGADYMMVATDKAGQALLTKHLPANQVAGKREWRLATTSQSFVWKSIWYGFAGLALLVVIGILQYDRLLTLAANQISKETELKLGQTALNSYINKEKVVKQGPAVDFVKTLGSRLTKGSEYQYQWFVVNDPMVNAFAMPGGIVVVNAGLLKKTDSANEVAAVLAHEIQHVEQKHALKNLLNRAGMAAVLLVVLGDASAAMVWITDQVSSQFFSRKVEKEADAKGIELLLANKIDASGMASFFKKLNALTKGQAVPEWLSSHPDTEDRIQLSEQFVTQHPCGDCETLVWDKAAILKSFKSKQSKQQKYEPNHI